jgi:hypothetical protein
LGFTDFASPFLAISTFGASASAGGWNSEDTYPRFIADVNGDFRVDIVGFASNGVYVALGTGDGHFGSPFLALAAFGQNAAAGGWTSQHEYARQLADINGDNRADIIGFGASGTYYALGQVDGTFGPVTTDIAAFGSNAAAGGWTDQNTYPRLVANVDATGDRHADIVGFASNGVFVSQALDYLFV